MFAEGAPQITFDSPPWCVLPSERGLQLDRETLHHQSDRWGNTVQVYPLRIQRQYTRFRRPGRQPPHPGRYCYQSARFRGAPRAHDVFIPRSSAEHLAGVIRATSSQTVFFVGAWLTGIEKQWFQVGPVAASQRYVKGIIPPSLFHSSYDINFENLFRLQRFFMASMRRPRLVELSQA